MMELLLTYFSLRHSGVVYTKNQNELEIHIIIINMYLYILIIISKNELRIYFYFCLPTHKQGSSLYYGWMRTADCGIWREANESKSHNSPLQIHTTVTDK